MMSAPMSEPRLILTCGLPGAGKTTLAHRLADERPAVRLSKDEWLWAMGSSPWVRGDGERMEHQLWALAQEMLRVGTSVIVDFGLWARVERDEMRSAARALGVAVELHHLHAPIDELWERIERRNATPPWSDAPISRADLDEWSNIFEPPDAAEMALFDPPPETED